MKIAKSVFVILGLALFVPFPGLAPAAHAQEQWTIQFGTSEDDFVWGMSPDGAGGMYVAGWTEGSLAAPVGGRADAFVGRFDENGVELWIRQFGSSTTDVAFALAPDGAGGVFVAGDTIGNLGGPNRGGSDIWIARYDGAGSRLWVRQFGSPLDDSWKVALASDGAGGVYIADVTYGFIGSPTVGFRDVFLIHYSGAGVQSWTRRFGTTREEYSEALASDGAGGVFVAGSTDGSLGGPSAGLSDAYVVRISSTGNPLWIRQFGSADFDTARALAPDGAGGVFVAGITGGDLGGPHAGGGSDAFVARHDSNGNQLWIRQFGTSANDRAYALAPDGAGGVFVTGQTGGSLGGPHAGGGSNVFIAHYDGAGNQIRIRQFAPKAARARAFAAASDGAGGVIVGGDTFGSLGGPNAGRNDAFAARYIVDSCYADCDLSTGANVLDLFDFLCFQGSFVNGEPYACDCDTSTGPLVCDLFDFLCFQGAFVGGCP